MAWPEKEYVVHSSGFTNRRGKNWLEILRRWLVRCPKCSEVRIVVGAHENDRYVCKDCGHSFAIEPSIATKNNPEL